MTVITHDLIHLSDPHLVPGEKGAPARSNLQATLAGIAGAGRRARVLVVTGDLGDDTDEAYEVLAGMVADADIAERVVYVAGNHDDPAQVRARLVGADAVFDEAGHSYRVSHDGIRVLVVDTTIAGSDSGAISEAAWAWLERELAKPAQPAESAESAEHTVVAMHHPPIAPVQEANLTYALRHEDQERFAALMATYPVAAVLAGHYHYRSGGTAGGVPVLIAGSTKASHLNEEGTAYSATITGVAVGSAVRFDGVQLRVEEVIG